MIIISSFAEKQIQSLLELYGTYKTNREVGRSAFWIWYDKVLNEIRTVNVEQSQRIGNGAYRYHMEYWGDILFKTVMVRNRGRFAGYNILITDVKLNIDNFHRWLQHAELIEPSPIKKSNVHVLNKRSIVRDIKMGYTKVRSNSGLWAVADANGKPISDYRFKDIANMRRTRSGEIATIVNKDGWAFAYFPNRDVSHRFVNMKKSYVTVIAEAAFNKVFNDEFNHVFGETMLNESTDNIDVRTFVNQYKRRIDGWRKEKLFEKYYNPLREPMIDGNLNGYDVLDGAKEKQIICDIPEKGWVKDIRMYSKMRTGGKTYCLYQRVDNGKYFFIEVYDDPRDEQHLHGKAIPKKNVPNFIFNDAISLIRRDQKVQDFLRRLQIDDCV